MREITPKQMAMYREGAKRHQEAIASRIKLRYDRTWEIAHVAAQILKQEYQATSVIVFGSVLNLEKMHDQSDLDLAVWGVNEKYHYRAVARLLDIDPAIPIDLILLEFAPDYLVENITKQGVNL